MKNITIRVYNYKTATDKFDYQVAIGQPDKWHFSVTNGATTHFKSGYKTKSAAISAAKAFRKHAKTLGLV